MSYGVSISYTKYPLTQALEQGVTQLFYKAKKTCEKNAVAFNILKHSGQNIASMFHKHLCSYNLFEALLTSKVADDNYVRSITYKLEPQAAVLFGIGCEKDFTNRNEKFDNFFRNNFNEDIHTKRNNKDEKILIDFLEKTKELIKAIYTENPITTIEQSNENLNKVYTALRFVDFLNNEEER
ncbi:MAG: hypothetical protein IPQ19_04500 [Bacteroidetes bacterium]|nr:hypothetical protein [Bacteroidota bacterium]